MRRLDLAPRVIDDLREMRAWQTQYGSGDAGRRRADNIVQAIEALVNHPCRYPIGPRAGMRQMIVERHVVVYRVAPDTGDNRTAGDVLVVRVFGPGQQRDRL